MGQCSPTEMSLALEFLRGNALVSPANASVTRGQQLAVTGISSLVLVKHATHADFEGTRTLIMILTKQDLPYNQTGRAKSGGLLENSGIVENGL
jgi:hypothetical protein